jgi:DNA-binding NarL/FixJ family response regulator
VAWGQRVTEPAAVVATEPIRVALLDDHPALREGTAGLLEREPDLRVVGLAGTLAEAADLIASERPPDVLVVDIRLGSERGLDVLGSVATIDGPRPAIVVWTAYDLPQYAAYALRAGASGFVLKTSPTHELIEAIRRAAAGGVHFSRRPGAIERPLTPREHDIVGYVVAGRSNDEIAAAMGIGTRAVEAHLTRLYERSGARSRAELAAMAEREAWLELPPA